MMRYHEQHTGLCEYRFCKNTARAEKDGGEEPWPTHEGIFPVKPGYGEADLEGIDFLETWPGIAPLFCAAPTPLCMGQHTHGTIRQ